MNNILSLFLLFFLFAACKSDPVQEESQEEKPIPQVAISNELKAQYEHYSQILKDPFSTKCIAELNKVNPVDAAPLDTAFFVFREQLKEIVTQKNIFELLKHVDENIKMGFGDENGLKEFITAWDLSSEEKIPDSKLWPTLKEILDLGGVFTNDDLYFEAPYLDPCYPHSFDVFETGAIIGAGVRMRAGTSLDTKVLKTLSYDVVDFIEITPITLKIGGETHPWIKVKTQDGVEGFVYGKFYRSPIDYRLSFNKNANGEWKMRSLLAGD